MTRGVSEVISTIMLNSIAIALYGYLLQRYGQHEGNTVRSTPIPASTQLDGWAPFSGETATIWTLRSSPCSLGVAFWFVINKTRFGFDLRATGMSQTAAVASGVSVNKMVVVAMLLSGGVAGLIWMPAFFGDAHSIGPTFQAGLGFTGIAVALLGRNQPIGIFFGAVLFAFLNEQSNRLQFETDISTEIVQITQGVIVLSVVIAFEVVRRYRNRVEQSRVARDVGREQTIRRAGGGDGMSATVQTPEPDTSTPRKKWLPDFGGMTGYRWWLTVTLLGLFLLSVVRVVTGADGLDSTGTLRAARHRDLPDPDGRYRRSVERARRRRQHRPRGPDDPRHLGCGVLHLLVRPVAGHPRCGADGCDRRVAARDRDRHLRRRPHRLRCGDQHHRRRCRASSSRVSSSSTSRAAASGS